VAKKFLVCQLLFIPLLVLFIFSICVSVGIVSYSITHNMLIGVGLFLFTMSVVLVGLVYWQKYLMQFFGFKDTISQLKEGMDVISKASQSLD
jgi:ABC-type nickel/cobalt efflux system permease component RcnA